MEPRCDYCGVSRALVYCKSDLAKLCLNCDGCIHSANPLSRRHLRSLICEKCFEQSCVIRCLDEKLSLCQGCLWTNKCSYLGHCLQNLNPYSGCPSPVEFAKIWSLILEPFDSTSDSRFGWISSDVGSYPFNQNYLSNNGLKGSSSSMVHTQNLRDQSSFFYDESNIPKEEDICEGLNMDDAPLNFDAGEDIMASCSDGYTKYNQSEVTVADCLLLDKNSSVTESNCPNNDNAIEASSSGQQDCISYRSQRICGSTNDQMNGNGKGNQMVMSLTSDGIDMELPPTVNSVGQIHGSMSLSLSNITGESSAADYQDCGLSQGILMGDSPWESNLEVSCPQARDQAKLRYKQKKSKRMFGKQIRYASRKARADTRKRVKGRFVKAGDAYDYDPLEDELLKSSNQRDKQ